MKSTFKIFKRNRECFLELLESLSIEQLNTIPPKMSNNLIWNYGHIITTQQRLAYKLTGEQSIVSEELFAKYLSGSKPSTNVTLKEFEELKELSKKCIEKTIVDYEAGLFKSFKEMTSSTGFHFATLEEALEFNNYHEALHYGFMNQIKKLV